MTRITILSILLLFATPALTEDSLVHINLTLKDSYLFAKLEIRRDDALYTESRSTGTIETPSVARWATKAVSQERVSELIADLVGLELVWLGEERHIGEERPCSRGTARFMIHIRHEAETTYTSGNCLEDGFLNSLHQVLRRFVDFEDDE